MRYFHTIKKTDGKDFTEDGADHATYTIDDIGENHRERIKIYGSSELRDRIVALLNGAVAPEPTVDPGEGYRLLEDGEVMLATDEFQFDGAWKPAGDAMMHGTIFSKRVYIPHRRALFNWNTLWSQLSPWINWVAMDDTGLWYGHFSAFRVLQLILRCSFRRDISLVIVGVN